MLAQKKLSYTIAENGSKRMATSEKIALASFLLSCFGAVFWFVHHLLADPKSRQEMLTLFKAKTFWACYQNAVITYLLAPAYHWFGEKPISWRMYSWCLIIAFIYPIWLLIISWVLGGTGELGELVLLNNLDKSSRFPSFALLVVLSIFCYWFIAKGGRGLITNQILDFFITLKLRLLLPRTLLKTMAFAFAFSIAFIGAGSIVVAFAETGVGGFTIAVGFAVAITVAITVAEAAAFAGATIIAIVFAIALVSIGSGTGFIVPLIIFLVLLPIFNALWDCVSVAASRSLITHLVNQANKRWLLLAAHIVADVVLAIVFMLCITISIPAILQSVNIVLAYTNIDVVIGWPVLLEQARQAPFTAGLAVTGMLFTTLIPTLLHLVVCIMAYICPHTPMWLKKPLFRWLGDKNQLSKLRLSLTTGLILLLGMISVVPVLLLIVGISHIPSAGGAASWIGQNLHDLALAVGHLIGGPGFEGNGF